MKSPELNSLWVNNPYAVTRIRYSDLFGTVIRELLMKKVFCNIEFQSFDLAY